MSKWWRWFQRGRSYAILLLIAALFVGLVPGDSPGGNSVTDRVLGKADDILFNYVAWELDAIGGKLTQTNAGAAPYLDEKTRSAYVIAYLRRVGALQEVEARINALYSDPTVSDPDTASAEMRRQRDQWRVEVTQLQPLAESIIETQVASILRDEGFSIGGEIIPPVSAHVTRPPMLLVVSPRDQIRYDFATNVLNLSADAMNTLEYQIDSSLAVSSLVVPIGGIGLYPTMVMETWSPVYLFSTVAHEWSHNYMLFFPIGWGYMSNPETRIINETTATVFGNEIGRKVIERFYADYPSVIAQLPPLPQPRSSPQPDSPQPTPIATATPIPRDPDESKPFDFGTELNRTRITVDFLLHFGLIDVAEGYMEARRREFAIYGIRLRKLNQAFFSFYGGYQGSSGQSAGGGDPTGAAIENIRSNSPTIKAWLEAMRGITTRAELLQLRDQMMPKTDSDS